jgi:hypothetical protein
MLESFLRSVRADERTFEVLASLCDDVGPRFPCTAGDVAAIDWAQKAMRAAGLTNVHTEVAPATLWRRGAEACVAKLPREQPLVLSALGGSVGARGLEGRIVLFESLADLDAADPSTVEGRVVLLHHVMPRTKDGVGYNAGSVVRMSGASRAAKKGALACLVRSIGTDCTRAPHTGALFYEAGAPQIPAAALATPDADLLARALRAGREVSVRLDLDCEPLPVGESANVVGEVRGRERPEEIVLLGAHLDSWDLGVGALDDGAGCAIALEVARLLAAAPTPPRRTVRVVLFANEELGTGGGLAYAARHASEARLHVAAIEADQGDGAPWALRVPAGARDGALTQRLRGALEGLEIALDEGPSRGGVDIGPLRSHGVPFVDLRQDASRYFDFHHTENDVLESVSRPDLSLATACFAAVVRELAEAEETFQAQPPPSK